MRIYLKDNPAQFRPVPNFERSPNKKKNNKKNENKMSSNMDPLHEY